MIYNLTVCSVGDTVTIRWRISLLLCSYFHSAVRVLSRQRKARLLLLSVYAALLALIVDAVLSRVDRRRVRTRPCRAQGLPKPCPRPRGTEEARA